MGRHDLMPVSAGLLGRFATLGVDVPALLAHVGLGGVGPDGLRITTPQFFALWQALERFGAGRDFGLRIAEVNVPNRYSIPSAAALNAPTFADALDRFARYKRISCPEEVAVEVEAGEARVRFEWLLAEVDPPALLIDAVLAGALMLARTGTGTSIRPRRIALTRRKRDVTMLRTWFGCEVSFDAPADLIAFDDTTLALPFVTHDPNWSDAILPGLGSELAARGHHTITDHVKRTLGRKLGERPSVDRVAKALGMSSRTLQRRLGEAGTTYQSVLDDVRRRSARRLLGETDLDAPTVAFLLGFEELNSFTRAFRAWEGKTPLRWRNSQ